MSIDYSNLSNDDLRAHGEALILEVENRRPHCRLAKLFHRVGSMLESQAHDEGQISTLSVGGGKDGD